jgi:hypothetical protein
MGNTFDNIVVNADISFYPVPKEGNLVRDIFKRFH